MYIVDKNKILEQVYHDPFGYGSLQKYALEDVKKWKEENVEQTKQHMRNSRLTCSSCRARNTKWE